MFKSGNWHLKRLFILWPSRLWQCGVVAGWQLFEKCTPRLTNLYHACPKWQRKIYLGTRLSQLSHNFYIVCPTSVSILWTIYVLIHICECVASVCELPVLPSKTASEIFLHKSGAVRSVDWIFIIGLPVWRWLGEYVTLDRTLFKQEAVAAPVTSTFFFIYRFPRGGRF